MVVLVITYYHTWCVLSVFIGLGGAIYLHPPKPCFLIDFRAIGLSA